MACVPGTPCFENTVNAYYPQQCNNGAFAGYPIPTSAVQYNGPALPNSGIDTGDTLTLALQKLDNALDPVELVQTLITVINQNPSLKVMFCTLVNSCAITPTTTTTTTITPTTTTTTSSSTSTTTSTSTSTTSTSTSTSSTTTTTTTVDPNYYYLTNRYDCPDCSTITANNFLIKGAFPVNVGDWVIRNPGTGFLAFQVLSVASPDPSAYLVDTFGSSSTCPCPTPPTTTTTTTPAPTYTVGQAALGGIIAYILQPGDPGYDPGVQHGLVAASTEISGDAPWGCEGTLISGADGTALGTGNQNTIDIMAGCATAGIAARLCGDLVEGGYSDWYLPSKNELFAILQNFQAINAYALFYWSSTESSDTQAWEQNRNNNVQFVNQKSSTAAVRPIRSF
jgi:hypothetical protein